MRSPGVRLSARCLSSLPPSSTSPGEPASIDKKTGQLQIAQVIDTFAEESFSFYSDEDGPKPEPASIGNLDLSLRRVH